MDEHRSAGVWGRRLLLVGLLPLLVVGSLVLAAPAAAQERAPRVQTGDRPPREHRDRLPAGGSLGFALRDTVLDEALYRRAPGNEPGLLWSAVRVPLGAHGVAIATEQKTTLSWGLCGPAQWT